MSSSRKQQFANFLTATIDSSPKSQVQIAKEAGFDNANIVTMIKQGKTNLPIGRIQSFAKAIGVDSFLLLKLAFLAYQPENWPVIEEEIERRVRAERRA